MQRCNPKGCERVAGGRSEAKTTGRQATRPHPDGVPDKKGMQEILFVTSGCNSFLIVPVVFASLQPPATICQPSGLMLTRRVRVLKNCE